MFDTIPSTPAAVVDVPLDPPAALGLAAQALAAERPLASTFMMSKVVGELTGQQQNGIAYRTFVRTPMMRMRMNDGYITATQTGPNTTRLQIHESKRYVMIMGIVTAVSVAVILLAYFLLAPSKTPLQRQWEQWQHTSSFDWSIPLWIGVVLGLAFAGWQIFEMVGLPGKLATMIRQGPGHPGMAPPFGAQPGFGPGQPAGQFHAGPQGGFAPPLQQGFTAPQPQPFGAAQGFPAQPPAHPHPQMGGTPGFPPAPQPGGFPPPPQQQPGFPAPQPAPPAQPFGQEQGMAVPPPQPSPVGPTAPQEDPAIAAQIEELGKLRDGGIITDADYDQARAAILAKRG